jgi:biotin synthase-related radical SAM superfamily protein
MPPVNDDLISSSPEKIRVSLGSAIVLELIKAKADFLPTTVYLLTYREGKCLANCGFCPQARASTSRADTLSRITWPAFPIKLVISKLNSAWQKEKIQRVCIQALNYPEVFDDLLALTTEIRLHVNLPISISCQPLNNVQMKKLANAGVNRVSVALDAATKELFEKIKGSLTNSPYNWVKQRRTLDEAIRVYGKGSVSTHLIVGLGETESQIIETIQWCVDLGVCPSLFAFTPISGTTLERLPRPSISSYRRVQLARYLIVSVKTRFEKMRFNDYGRLINFGVKRDLLEKIVKIGTPFQTSGCPGCNRPCYNEKASGPIYNYPRPLTPKELKEVEKALEIHS